MEGRATKRAVWSSRMGEDVDPPTVYKEIRILYAKYPLAEEVQGGWMEVKV